MAVRLDVYGELLDRMLDAPASKENVEKAWQILKELMYIDLTEQFDGERSHLLGKAKLVIEKWYGIVGPDNLA